MELEVGFKNPESEQPKRFGRAETAAIVRHEPVAHREGNRRKIGSDDRGDGDRTDDADDVDELGTGYLQ